MNEEAERPRKKRMHLTMKSKQEICQRKQINPSLSITELAEEYNCDRSTVAKILKAKNEWLSKEFTMMSLTPSPPMISNPAYINEIGRSREVDIREGRLYKLIKL